MTVTKNTVALSNVSDLTELKKERRFGRIMKITMIVNRKTLKTSLILLCLAATTLFAARGEGAIKSNKDIGLHSDGGAWQFYRQAPNGDLPRVLLIGDSIMNGYNAQVISAADTVTQTIINIGR